MKPSLTPAARSLLKRLSTAATAAPEGRLHVNRADFNRWPDEFAALVRFGALMIECERADEVVLRVMGECGVA